jgi:hypothetical protein
VDGEQRSSQCYDGHHNQKNSWMAVFLLMNNALKIRKCALRLIISHHDAVHSCPLNIGSWSIPNLGANVSHAGARLIDEYFFATTPSWRTVPDHWRKHSGIRRVVESGYLVCATAKHVAPSFWPVPSSKTKWRRILSYGLPYEIKMKTRRSMCVGMCY